MGRRIAGFLKYRKLRESIVPSFFHDKRYMFIQSYRRLFEKKKNAIPNDQKNLSTENTSNERDNPEDGSPLLFNKDKCDAQLIEKTPIANAVDIIEGSNGVTILKVNKEEAQKALDVGAKIIGSRSTPPFRDE